MKRLLTLLLAVQILLALTGCCCPCAKKMHNGQPAEQQPAENQPAE